MSDFYHDVLMLLSIESLFASHMWGGEGREGRGRG